MTSKTASAWTTGIWCYAVLLVPMVSLGVFTYLAVIWAIQKSFYDYEIGAKPHFVGFANYSDYLAHDPATLGSVGNVLLLTFFGVATRLIMPLVTAKVIYSLPSERSRYFYRLIFLVPAVIPTVAVQLIWLNMVYADHGLLNEGLRLFHQGGWARDWLNDPKTALVACAMVGFPFIGGFDVLIYYAGFANIPESVHEAALLDGCTGVRKFLSLDVPLVLQQVKLIFILALINGLQGFEGLFILTKGGPGFSTMVPGLMMYLEAFTYQRFGYACAIGVLLFLFIIVATLFNLRLNASRPA